MKESARAWIERVSQRRERFLRRTYEAGQRMVAEGYIERALEFWSALPDDYENIAARRKELAAQGRSGHRSGGRGQPLLRTGRCRPRRRRVGQSRRVAARRHRTQGPPGRRARSTGQPQPQAQLPERGRRRGGARQLRRGAGPLPEGARPGPRDASALLVAKEIEAKERELADLKHRYLSQAGEAAETGDFDDALALCRKALDLDPSDASALLVIKEIEDQARGLAGGKARARSAPLHLKPILVAPAFLGVIAVGLWFFCWHIPARRAQTAARIAIEANKALDEALLLKEAGKPSDVIALCGRVATDYPGTIYADKANDLSAEMREAGRRRARALQRGGSHRRQGRPRFADRRLSKVPGDPFRSAGHPRRRPQGIGRAPAGGYPRAHRVWPRRNWGRKTRRTAIGARRWSDTSWSRRRSGSTAIPYPRGSPGRKNGSPTAPSR